MSILLKQSTSVDVPIGPFVDSTDGVTPETALTITQPDVRLKKNAAAWAQKAAAQTLTHEENGYYEVTLDATDTDTLGRLRIAVNESGALPVWQDFMVVAANVYDSLIGGGDTLDVQVTGIGANVITATSINADAITDAKVASDVTIASVTGAVGSVTGAVGSVAAGGITAASFAADAITAAKIAADVTTELQAGLATSAALATAQTDLDDIQTRLPAVLVSGRMDASVGAMAAAVITATAIAADAITDAKVAADVTIASVTGAVGSVTGSVGSVTGNVGGSVASVAAGGITAASFGANAINAAKLDPDVTTELQAGLATSAALATAQTSIDDVPTNAELAAALGTADDAVLAQVALVKAQTDLLPSDPADQSLIIAATNSILSRIGTPAGADLVADIATRASQTSVDAVDNFVDTEITAIKDVTDKLNAMTETGVGSPSYNRFTAPALELAPTGGSAPTAVAIANEVQTRTIAAVTLVTTATNLTNAPTAGDLTATMKASVTTAASAATPTVTAGTVSDKTGYRLSATGVDDMWDEAIAGHLAAGSTGKALNDATSAGNPWNSVLEGTLTAGNLLRILAGVAAGKTDIVDNENGTATVTFRDASDLSLIVSAAMVGSERTSVTLTP